MPQQQAKRLIISKSVLPLSGTGPIYHCLVQRLLELLALDLQLSICVCVRLSKINGGIAVRAGGKEDNWQKTNWRHYVTLPDSMRGADMIFVKSFTQAYTLTFRNLPEENA